MDHLLNHAAHAVVRGAIYRVVWHTPPLLVAGLVILAVVYIARRYP